MVDASWQNLREAEEKGCPDLWFAIWWGWVSETIYFTLAHATIFLTEKSIDLKTVDLKKLKVRDLKKILSDWEEDCEDCIEKKDFINRIEKLKPKYLKEDL